MRWNAPDDQFLLENWQALSHAEIGTRLGRSERAVRNRCWRLGLVDDLRWSAEEETHLRRWYAEHDGQALNLSGFAALYGRSVPNISRKARGMGLTNQRRKKGARERRTFKGDKVAARKAASAAMKKWIAENGHPRGMLGKKKSAESVASGVAKTKNWRALQSSQTLSDIALRAVETRIQRYGTAAPVGVSNPYSRAKRGRRDDLGGYFFRSRWEANYARFLNLLKAQGQIEKWEYEAETFWFDAIRRGIRSYTPDFKVWERGGAIYYVEVKGWMDAKSKTKLKRMKKYYPSVDLRLFGAKAYREIERKLGVAIPGWET